MDARGPRLAHQTKPLPVCPCADGWRCAAHPDEPYGHDGCAAARVPCPRCQPDVEPPVPYNGT